MMPICRTFLKNGQCPNGNNCFLSHELPLAKVESKAVVSSNASLVQMQALRKSTIAPAQLPQARFTRSQTATRGAAQDALVDRIWGAPTPAAPSAALPRANIERSDSTASSDLYKTELCRSWTQTSNCPYGLKCQFAHGIEELRKVQRHPKWKTIECKQYHMTGSCTFGPRCVFVHEESERRAPSASTSNNADVILSAAARKPVANRSDAPSWIAEPALRPAYVHPESRVISIDSLVSKRFERPASAASNNKEEELIKRIESSFQMFGGIRSVSPQ